jgi:RNA polymerase sigma factor (sigma-70 family)
MTDEDRNALITPAMVLCAKIHARQYCRTRPQVDYDVVEASALKGLWDAAINYDPEKASFGTWADRVIEWSIRNDERTFRGKKPKKPLPITGGPTVAVPREEERLLAKAIAACAERLPNPYGDLMRLCYVDDLSQRECAEALGLAPNRVSQLHGEAIGRLRQLFSSEKRSKKNYNCSVGPRKGV